MATGAVAVRGLADLQRAFKLAGKDARKEVRAVLGEIAEPVRQAAESFALAEISGLSPTEGKPTSWHLMRIGVTQKLIYVAPKQRGRQTRKNRRLARPNMGDLLMEKAMQPALAQHEHSFEARMERAVDRIVSRWEHRP